MNQILQKIILFIKNNSVYYDWYILPLLKLLTSYNLISVPFLRYFTKCQH